MGPALTRPSRYISRQASCRLAPSDETVRDTYRLHGAPARSVPSRGPIGGLGGYVVTVRLCGGSPGPQRCGTNQYIGADHATKQGHEGRRSVAPVGPIRLQLALEVVYEGRSRLPNGGRPGAHMWVIPRTLGGSGPDSTHQMAGKTYFYRA